jgi:hypothetical protein
MEHLVLPETRGDDSMTTQVQFNNWDTMVVEDTDVAIIAKNIRTLIKSIPGATFSVTINRQWSKVKSQPHSVIYVQGMVKFWADSYSDKKQEQSNLMLLGMLKDVAEEHQLEIVEGMYAASYMLIQYH